MPQSRSHSAQAAMPAGLLVNMIGLLANFLFLRDGQTQVDADGFIAWLREHRHIGFLRRLEARPAVLQTLRMVLTEGHGDLVERLEAIDEGLVLLCGSQGAFAALARAVRPDLGLKAVHA